MTYLPGGTGRRHRLLTLLAVVVLVAGALLVRAQTPAHADVSTAMQKCQRGDTPEHAETVVQPGTEFGTSYPRGADPDNAILPGDVVRVTVSGTIQYDVWGNPAGPAGNGAAASGDWPFPGLSQYSSVARWNNNPGGWVGDPMQTTALGGCTAAPSLPVRLLYYVNDGMRWDNGGQWTIRTEVWRAPGRISIDGVEFTQGIQTPDGQVPLLAGKRTFVRVYVRGVDDGRGPLSGVIARMTVGSTVRWSSSITVSPRGSDRRSLTDSFLFELDAAAVAAGSRQVTIEVYPPPGRGDGRAAVRHATPAFGPSGSSPTLTFFAARYSYSGIPSAMQRQEGLTSATWPARPVSAWEPMRATAENALPLTRLSLTELAPSSAMGSTTIDCRAVLGEDGRWGCAGYLDGQEWADRTVNARCPHGGCWIVVLQPETACGCGTHYVNGLGNHVINIQGEADPDQAGLTLAHELGHGLSLPHTWDDPAYPRADGGLGPFVGFRYTPSARLVSGQDTAGRTTAYDLMSYSGPAWISPYNYCKAMAAATGNRLTCPPALRG